MERTIITKQSDENLITLDEVRRKTEDGEGLIFIYKKDSNELSGSVIWYNDEWLLSTYEDEECDEDLFDLLDGYESRYSFRYREKERTSSFRR